MSRLLNIKISDEYSGRIDKVLSDIYPEFTRSFIQKQIEDNNLKANGKTVPAKYKVKLNDIIELSIPAPRQIETLAQDIDIDIVYEDSDIVIVNKPQGMVVHPSAGHDDGTMVNALLYHCKGNLSGINGEIRPGIVHRIDKDTSGLLMVAKNDSSHFYLSNLLKDHNITRKYHAIVYGVIKEDEGIIEKPIQRCQQDRKKMGISQNGKFAKTKYKVLERFKDTTYVELSLFTGRTHQIRVHMTSIGHPLVGDPVYGRKKHLFGLNKQTLHAKILGFTHPSSLNEMYFESEIPIYFKDIIDKCKKI
ncbi:RNA pseudouridine synthase [Candidatus Epulonipiscium fishelsonii]|uniref:RNA pseudouridine synthase n=1 Tax=Candidatus Epulonipiscium fishelsonii TaxID=77094 RepID=A0ACC8XJ82_9FIRM|nr:RNA pseudouridine synthase [Epulopiscium sp. SCG-D08WGA-EpuloA1]